MSPANKNKKSIAIVMDPVETIKPKKDSTVAMIEAAEALGAECFYMTPDDLFVKDKTTYALSRQISLTGDLKNWHSLVEPQTTALKDFDLVLMRKDPPVDKRFIHTCYMLEQAERNGARVLNNPKELVSLNEKLFAGHFPDLCPETLVASSHAELRDFVEQHKKIIIKPLDSMGGAGVFMVTDTDVNFDVVWEIQTQRGTYPVMAQNFLPSIMDGDKRVIVINGKAFGHVLVRSPKPGSIRGNMAAGGNTHVREINEAEQKICDIVGAVLVEKKIMFAGVDIIGDKLIEINITSPTGLREISKECGINVADILMREMLA